MRKQVEKAVKSANSIIAQIKNSFTYFDAELVKLLYVSMVRPHLEYAVSVWNPYLRKDIDKLESVQRRATRLVPKLRKKSYEYRLTRLGLTSLETRRKRGYMIQYYKTINGLDKLNWTNEPRKINKNNTSHPGYSLRREGTCIYKEPIKNCKFREEFFLNRIVPVWNKLPINVKEAKSLNSFKAGLDRLNMFSV